MKITTKIIDATEVGKLASQMRKEHVSFKKDDKKTTYIGAYNEAGELLGVVGYQEIRGTARYKTAFVKPMYRRQGVYTTLWKARHEMVLEKFGKRVIITSFCTPNSLPYYLQNGFKEVSKNPKNNVTFVCLQPKTHGKLGTYKEWTSEQRLASLKLTKKAKTLGLIPLPTKCQKCGTTEGTIQHHNPDYNFTLNTLPAVFSGETPLTEELKEQLENCLIPICKSCHLKLHREENTKP